MIDVSDLFDAFHAIAQSIWRDFGVVVDDEAWDDIIDGLELDLFLAACAHRVRVTTGEEVEPDHIPARITLIDADGRAVVGAAGQYHSHAFYPDASTGVVPNAVMCGNLLSKSRTDVALVIAEQRAGGRHRRPQLPQLP